MMRAFTMFGLMVVMMIGITMNALAQAFTYQGFLRQSGTPANGNFDFRFRLYADPNDESSQIGTTQFVSNVNVQNGLFTVSLNFGNVWDGNDRYLEIGVRPSGGGDYQELLPRVRISLTPYSAYAFQTPWSGIVGMPEGFADGIDNDTTYTAGTGLALTGTEFSLDLTYADNRYINENQNAGGDLSGTYPNPTVAKLQGRPVSSTAPGNGQVLKWNGSSWAPANDGLTLPYAVDFNTNLSSHRVAFGDYISVVFVPAALGVYGRSEDTTGVAIAVGVYGQGRNSSGAATGVWGRADGATVIGVQGDGYGNNSYGVRGFAPYNNSYGVYGSVNTSDSYGVYSRGRFAATGTKSFQIDHPLMPETHYLNHFCTEAPEPINFYSGNVVTDAQGYATVQLPNYFEAINRDFRYQLTVIDDSNDFVLAKVVREIQNNQFVIRTSKPNVKVSWRVEAIRNDLWVQKYGFQTEQEKLEAHQGKFLHPELYGQPEEKGIHYMPRPHFEQTQSNK